MRKRFIGVTYLFVSLVASTDAVPAKTRRVSPKPYRQQVIVPAASSVDAVMLSSLSPPSNPSTRGQTYGDADYARSRQQRRIADAPLPTASEAPLGIDLCDPRGARAAGYTCAPTYQGYGQFYAYLPTYASAPQVPRGDPTQQSSILAPATALSWAVNTLRIDPHN